MSFGVPSTTLFTATTAAAGIGNSSTAELSFIPTAGVGSMTIPANHMIPGRIYQLMTYGTYQTPAAPGAVTVKIKLGSVTIVNVPIAASILATSSVLRELYGVAFITCRTTGTSGTVTCSGYLTFETATGATTVPFSTVSTNNTTPANSTVTVNTTIANLVDGTEQWSTSNAAQGTTIDQCILEYRN